jgi:hypothetical protein
MRKCSDALRSEVVLFELSLVIDFVAKQHFLGVVRADDSMTESLCRQAIDVVRVRVGQ